MMADAYPTRRFTNRGNRRYCLTMATSETRWGSGENAEAIQAWDGPLFDRWIKFRHIVTTGLGAHGDVALRLVPPQEGQRVLDIGCGLGDTTQQIGAIVGPSGEAVGVDAAERFIEIARTEAEEAGVQNATFFAADVQTDPLGGPYDMAFSRMGTMFFISPVAALRNVRQSLVPGGKLAMVVWRRREDNLWMYRAQQIVEGIVQKPEEYDEPTCGPGPFSMAGADTTSDILTHAGFTDISLTRSDIDILGGRTIDEALDLVMSIGPAGEILRLLGDRAVPLMPQVDAALREGLSEFVRDDGTVWAPASTWIVTATAPESS
jgi:SAM-dependent methyltransferase